MYEKTQRDVVPVEMVQSSSELEGHPTEEEGLPEGVNGMEERVMRDTKLPIKIGLAIHFLQNQLHHGIYSGSSDARHIVLAIKALDMWRFRLKDSSVCEDEREVKVMPKYVDTNEIIRLLSSSEQLKSLAESVHDERFVELLNNIPEADVVEVRHGEWIKRHNERTCSECRFIYYNSNDDFNYCPNCGAKMYGKEE